MTPKTTWLDDPGIFRLGQIPIHSDHCFYANYSEMKQQKNSLIKSLNGTWKFKFAKSPMQRPQGFYQLGYDAQDFDEITVPSHIELNGYGQIQYINTLYPWEGKYFRRPAYVPDENDPQIGMFSQGEDNTVGSYIKEFSIPDNFKGQRISVEFGGVERAMYLWINGHFLGYCEDSFAPSEYDLTPYLDENGVNTLAVEVFKHSTASFIEDQDMFRFSGIFRDVNLIARPRIHVEDLTIKPTLTDDLTSGYLNVVIQITGSDLAGSTVRLLVIDNEGQQIFNDQQPVSEEIKFQSDELSNIHLWDNLDPYLYSLIIEIRYQNDHLIEIVPYDFGFRKIEIKDNVILLNGKRLKLNGVNRHEWSANSGRVISMAEMVADMATIKQNNINAVRTCHYMDQIPWYYMGDQNGIYIMAENNLESHGSWQKMGAVEPSYNVPGSSPHWLQAVLNRAKNNYEVLKNHTSILFWSLGNESYAGDDIAEMNAYYTKQDPDRLVHYEGVCRNRQYEDVISDVESMMYFPPTDIDEYLANNPKKPFLSCEYMHDMGNSLGGLDSYMKLYDKYQSYSGGFIWDFIDQSLFVTDSVTGQQVLRYGGDFDDRHSDYEFSGDGLMFGNRTEKPAMQEVKYYYGKYRQ